MLGIYLGAYKAYHPGYNIVYQDINGKRDLGGDMLDVDLTKYDFIIATPPCNFWSKATNPNSYSNYALTTGHLLPDILSKLCKQEKPFIVENVVNKKRMAAYGVFNNNCFIYFVGRHTYFTNVLLSVENIIQPAEHIQKYARTKRQGGEYVHQIIEIFLETIHKEKQ